METNEQMLERLYELAEEQSGIVAGSHVKVLRAAKNNEYGWNNVWVTPDMNLLVGQVCKVIDKTGCGSKLEPIVPIEGYDPTFRFPFFVLEKVELERVFKPFDKVLVRNSAEAEWLPDIYRWYRRISSGYNHHTTTGTYVHCLPYEGNEMLAGTTNIPGGDNASTK